MALTLITPPSGEPVTLDEAKTQLRIENTLEDTFVGTLIAAARTYVEQICGRALLTQTWQLTLDDFPDFGMEIPLPKGDVQTVTSVKYDDESGVEQTFSSAKYIVDGYPPGRIVLRRAYDWPSTSGEVLAVRVLFVAGYGAAAAVPTPIKQAILMLTMQMYELREPDAIVIVLSKVGSAVDNLLGPYRILSV